MDALPLDPYRPPCAITEIVDRHGCLIVSGRVDLGGEWVDAGFTVVKGDIAHLSRDEFRKYALDRLPDFVVTRDWHSEVAV